MSKSKGLSGISLNLLYAMDGHTFVSETVGGIVEIKGEEMVTNTNNPTVLTDDIIELLYQEFIWNQEKKGLR